jgi:hypothetical protein
MTVEHPSRFAASAPDRPAVVAAADDRALTYGALEARTNRLAHALRRLGMTVGDHLAVLVDNRLEYFEAVWAGMRSGLLVTPINWHLAPDRFPELKLCMIHGADPWWDVAIRLMIKYHNLRLMTSAWSPKRPPETLLHFMTTRGKHRVIHASDSPVLAMERCLGEIAALDLPDDVRQAWLHDNAASFFFGAQ